MRRVTVFKDGDDEPQSYEHAKKKNPNRGIGLAFARYILGHTNLNLVATSQNPKQARESILEHLREPHRHMEDRLMTLELDVRREETIEKAAKVVKDRFGRQLRLLINVSGVVRSLDFHEYRETSESNQRFLVIYLSHHSMEPITQRRRGCGVFFFLFLNKTIVTSRKIDSKSECRRDETNV